jgi:hypothetical protein
MIGSVSEGFQDKQMLGVTAAKQRVALTSRTVETYCRHAYGDGSVTMFQESPSRCDSLTIPDWRKVSDENDEAQLVFRMLLRQQFTVVH